jgi:Nif-specific regulatory protein
MPSHRTDMNPKLIAIAGPLRGTIFSLCEKELSVGRDLPNQLLIDDRSVSRLHCRIRGEGECWQISDLDSHNGTFVNDIPVKERTLTHGDRIKIGSSLFVFLLREGQTDVPTSEIQLVDDNLLTKTAITFRAEDELHLMARDLSALMKISLKINSIRSVTALQHELLERLLEVIPAQRGAVLLVDKSTNEIASAVALNRQADTGGTIPVSRTVVQHVLSERVALLCNNVPEDDRLGTAESLLSASIRSLLCVPLVQVKTVLGAIYLDTMEPNVCLDQGHLQLVTAIANIAAGAVNNARRMEWLEGENLRLRADSEIKHSMIGESPSMGAVYQLIAKVAPVETTVLIRGESGTGKELAAHAIHQNSPRAAQPFVTINCAALIDTLIESELFGYEKGAFTGAIAQRKGKLEVANGGTVFLDEVGELSLLLQAKLLRVLQEREFERVGGTRPLKVDIRLLAATNKDLEQAVKAGTFRSDLYYRLNVVSLRMPPLREHPDDVPLLARYFAVKYSYKCKRKITSLAPETLASLSSYDWPGNVRELENAIERAVVLGSTACIQPEDLPEIILEKQSATDAPVPKYHEAVNQAKKQIVLGALAQAQGDYAETAKLLGIHPNNLHRLIRSMNLKVPLQK